MNKCKSKIAGLIKTYKKENDVQILKELIKMILLKKLKPIEYLELYKIKNTALRNIIILKAPIETVLNIIENDFENCNIDIIEIRLKKNLNSFEADKLIDLKFDEIKVLAAKYSSKEKIIDELLSQTKGALFHENFESMKKEQVIKKILDSLKKYELTQTEANKLIYSDYYQVRNYAMKYASKEELIEKLIIEKDYSIVHQIISNLGGYTFTKEEGDKLLFASSETVVELGVKYASKEKLIEKLLELKTCGNIVKKIFFYLKDYKFSDEEIDKLLNAISFKVRALITECAPKEKLVERLLVEDNFEVLEYIFYELRDYKFTETEISKLINAKHECTRLKIVEYASEEVLLNRLFVEDDESIIEYILSKLKNYYFSLKQADKFLESKNYKVRLYMVKFASLGKILERLLSEENDKVVKEIFFRLELYNFSQKEIDKLAFAKNHIVREYAVRYVSDEILVDMLFLENFNNIILKIFDRLRDYVFTEEQVNVLINSKNSNVREFIINYALKSQIIERLLVENNSTICFKLGETIKKYELTEQEAGILLNVNDFEVRLYAIKYASKEKIIERLKIEKRKEVISELINYIFKNVSKEEVIEHLAYINDLNAITEILNFIY